MTVEGSADGGNAPAPAEAGRRLELDVRLPLDRFEVEARLEAAGGVTALFGPSGAGKSSLLEVVAGLRRGARGRVALGGETWLDSERGVFLPPERRSVGYVPQEGLLFPHRDVSGNLLAGAGRARRGRRPEGRSGRGRSAGGSASVDGGRTPEASFERVVELLELEPLLGRGVATLSGGERQRVALGRALVSGPRLLLLDEPLAALDLPLRRRLLPFLARVRRELAVPMLLVSHDPVEVQALADRVLVLDRGRVVARGEPGRVLSDPRVFPLAGAGGYENVLAGRVVRREAGTTAVALAGPARPGGAERAGDGGAQTAELVTGPWEGEVGSEVLVQVPGVDVLVASEEPRGLSARNVLPAVVEELRTVGSGVLVVARLLPPGAEAGGVPAGVLPALVAEVTGTIPAELGLAPERRVHLVVKASSCRVFG